MELKRTFKALLADLEELRKPLSELVKLSGEFAPQKGVVHLIPRLYDQMVEAEGMCAEAAEAARAALGSVDQPADLHATRDALTACQESVNRLVKKFWQDVMSFDQVEDLLALGRERGRQWSQYASAWQSWIKDAIGGFHPVNDTLLLCWQELTERLAMGSVSVRATNIGQQITVPEVTQATREGIT